MEWELLLRWRVPPLNQWKFFEFRPLAKAKKRGAAGVVLGKSTGNESEKAFSMRFRRAKRAGGSILPYAARPRERTQYRYW